MVLGAGCLEERKDFQTLTRSFARLRRQQAAQLVTLGEGSLHGELIAVAAALEVTEDVVLRGFVRLYIPCEWFALPSKWEGMGILVRRWCAAARWCARSAMPTEPKCCVREGGGGTLVPVGDDAVLATAIVATIDNPPPSEPLVEGGQRRASCGILRGSYPRCQRTERVH